MTQAEPWATEAHRLCAAFPGSCGLVIHPLAVPELALTYQPDLPFSAASLIKLPMLLTYLLAVQDGALDPAQRLPLRAAAVVPGSGVLQDLRPGLQPTLADLAMLMIILSDNTATNMMIDVLGIESVNATLDRFGLAQTRLRRKMYDWEAQARGVENVTTAAEMARLLEIIWVDPALSAASRAQALAILGRQFYQGKLPFLTADPARWAHKTGELDDADHDAGFWRVGDTAVIVALLSSGGAGQKERVRLANGIGLLVAERFPAPS